MHRAFSLTPAAAPLLPAADIRLHEAHLEASLLVALKLPQGMQLLLAQQWKSLWHRLAVEKEALDIDLLPPPPSLAPAPPAAPQDEAAGGKASRFLALVPNCFAAVEELTFFGLVAEPMAAAQPETAAAAAAVAATTAAAAGAAGYMELQQGILKIKGTAAGAGALEAAVVSSKKPLVWADTLELADGRHYRAASARAQREAARPAQLARVHSMGAVVLPPRPLEGLRVSLIAFDRRHEVSGKRLKQPTGVMLFLTVPAPTPLPRPALPSPPFPTLTLVPHPRPERRKRARWCRH